MIFNLFSKKPTQEETKPEAVEVDEDARAAELLERLERAKARKARYCIDGLSGAVSILREVLEENPFYGPAQAMLAESYAFLGHVREMEELEFESFFEKAVTHAEAALHIDPKHAASHRAMAVALRRGPRANSAQRLDEATMAVQLDPADAENWIELWRAKGRPGNDETLSYALKLGSSNAGFLIDFGVVQFREKRFPEAEKYFRKALEAAPGNALATVNLAMALNSRRQSGAARDVVEAGLREDACSVMLKKAMEFLGSGSSRNLDVWASVKTGQGAEDPTLELAKGF
jgi:tetratricopeptide (TPR) repeat protein